MGYKSMKEPFRKEQIYIYVLFLCLLLVSSSIAVWGVGAIRYGRVYSHSDNEYLMELQASRLPVRIQLFSDRWGSCDITDSADVLSLWERIGSLPKAGGEDVLGDSGLDAIMGSVYFLNNGSVAFELSGYLKMDGIVYGGVASSFELTLLYNELLSRLFTVENISDLVLSEKSQVIVSDTGVQRIMLGTEERQRLSMVVRSCLPADEMEMLLGGGSGDAVREVDVIIRLPRDDDPRYVKDMLQISVYSDGYAEVYRLNMGRRLLSLKGPLREYVIALLGSS